MNINKNYIIIALLFIISMLSGYCLFTENITPKTTEKSGVTMADILAQDKEPTVEVIVQPVIIKETEQEEQIQYSFEEIEYLCKCVEAEAGNQSLLGKRLVADVILNRVESERFPNTITEVINAPGQFSVVSNGAINKRKIAQSTYEAVQMELNNDRVDTEILYFNCGKCSGTFCYKVDGHNFGK